MIDLSKTFLQCEHCHHNFSEPRHVCPACDWPRTHSDVTPPPAISQPDPSVVEAFTAKPQIHPHIINVDLAAPEQLSLDLSPVEPVAPVPQAPSQILADIPVPQVKTRRQPRTLKLEPDTTQGDAA